MREESQVCANNPVRPVLKAASWLGLFLFSVAGWTLWLYERSAKSDGVLIVGPASSGTPAEIDVPKVDAAQLTYDAAVELLVRGMRYQEGRFVPKDEEKAKECWAKAREGFLASGAGYNIQICTDSGRRLRNAPLSDQRGAFGCFLRAAQFGGYEAPYLVAEMYEQGVGCEQSEVDAYAWFNVAAAGNWRADEAAVRRDAIASRHGSEWALMAQRRLQGLFDESGSKTKKK